MNTSTHRNISTANFNIFALFFMLTFFSLNFSKAQDCNWGPPTSLNIVNVGTTFASLSWQHPVQGPAPGGYEVSVIRVSNGNKVTYNVNDTAYIVNNLSPGIQYLIEISPICANGLVSPNFISKIVITVVINDLVYPICPMPPSGSAPLGNVAGPVILNANLTTLNVPWVSWIEGTNRQIYYCEVSSPTNSTKYGRFVIVRDENSTTYYFKSKATSGSWKASLVSNSYIRIRNEYTGNQGLIGRIDVTSNNFTFLRLNTTVDLKIKVDLYSSCNVGSTSALISDNTDFENDLNFQQNIKTTSFSSKDLSDDFNIYYDYIDKLVVLDPHKINLKNSIISIYNINGNRINFSKLSHQAQSNTYTLDLNDSYIIPGVYIIELISENTRFIKKLILY